MPRGLLLHRAFGFLLLFFFTIYQTCSYLLNTWRQWQIMRFVKELLYVYKINALDLIWIWKMRQSWFYSIRYISSMVNILPDDCSSELTVNWPAHLNNFVIQNLGDRNAIDGDRRHARFSIDLFLTFTVWYIRQ